MIGVPGRANFTEEEPLTLPGGVNFKKHFPLYVSVVAQLSRH